MTDDKVAHRAASAKYAASAKGQATAKRRHDRRRGIGAPLRSYLTDDTPAADNPTPPTPRNSGAPRQ